MTAPLRPYIKYGQRIRIGQAYATVERLTAVYVWVRVEGATHSQGFRFSSVSDWNPPAETRKEIA